MNRRPTFGGVRGNFGSFSVLPILEQHLELADEQLLGTGKIIPGGETQGQVGIVQYGVDVSDDVFLVNGNA